MMFVRLSLWRNLFENFAAGWFGTIFVTVQTTGTAEEIILFLSKNILGGIICLLIAELIARREDKK